MSNTATLEAATLNSKKPMTKQELIAANIKLLIEQRPDIRMPSPTTSRP